MDITNSKTEYSKKRKKKHKTKITSMLAYAFVLENLGERQALVYSVIKRLKSCNNFRIAKELSMPINRVTPRVKELRDLGVVRQHKVDLCEETGRKVIYWKPLWWDF